MGSGPSLSAERSFCVLLSGGVLGGLGGRCVQEQRVESARWMDASTSPLVLCWVY
jgi:hypothetical protein